MRKAPLISVIIPVLNSEDCLETALRSVIHQTYKRIELIIIDGSSTDRSIEIIHQYKENITYWVSEPDKGIYDAMNKGVSMATGDWVYFLGADDILVNCLHKVSRHLKSQKTIYYGDVYLPKKNKVYGCEFKFHTLVSKNLNHQSIFYPKVVFDHYQFSHKYPILADYELNLRCWGERKFHFKYIPILVAIHNDAGLSHQVADAQFELDKPLIIDKYFNKRLSLYQKSFVYKKMIYRLLMRAKSGLFE